MELIHKDLAFQITEDFHNAFTGTSASAQKMTLTQMTDACSVVSVLEAKVKRDLLKWFIGKIKRTNP